MPSNVVRKYVGFTFFFNLLLWIPVFYEFQKQMGLSDPEIFGIQSIYYIAFCLLEVPTGFIADRFGYRFSMILGAATLVAANILPIWTPSYAGFLSHFLMIALARSLISGAGSAYLYEYLKSRGEAARYKKVEGDARFWSLVGRVAAWAAVGWLMRWQVASPYWISAVNAAVSLGIVLSMPVVRAAQDVSRPLVGGNVGHAIMTVLRSPFLILLMCQGVGIFVMVRVLQVNLYQPTLSAKGFDVTAFGWIMSLMTVFEAIGSKAAHRLRGYLPDMATVTAMTLVLSISLGLIAAFGQTGALVGFCLFSMASGVAFPVQKQLLNDAVTDSRLRATVLSMESILDRAVCALAVLPLGALLQGGYLKGTLAVTGMAAAAAALLVQAAGGRLRARATAVSQSTSSSTLDRGVS